MIIIILLKTILFTESNKAYAKNKNSKKVNEEYRNILAGL